MTGDAVRVAAVQLNSQDDVESNLARIGELLQRASDDGVRIAVLPENFALMPRRGRDKTAIAEDEGEGPIQQFLADRAKSLGVWIVGGSLPLRSPDEQRVYGASVVVDDNGETRAVYRKIHLFDVDLGGSGESYRESHSMYPGDDPVCVDTPAGRLGLTICYDLRFPELFRRLLEDGAQWFTVPAAFTQTTGAAHWHVLLRARAVENLAWVVAPGQTGLHPDERRTYGHSLICDPWGQVLAECDGAEGFVAANIDPGAQTKLRREFPALTNRRLAEHTIKDTE
ncbi:MAG: carbon-nitrogen hydrolase family protein [Pseudomonadota bacterium]